MNNSLLIKNAIKCLVCNTVLESKHRHDFVKCGCPNQAFVDGGLDYVKLGAVDFNSIIRLHEYRNK